MVHILENSKNTRVSYSAYNFPIWTMSDNSFTTIPINSKLYRTKPYVPSYKCTQLPSPSPHPQHTKPRQTPTHSVSRSVDYTPGVASPPIHPSSKHLHSTTGNITTPHDICSAQDSTVTPGFKGKTECIAYVCQDLFPHICWHHKYNISKEQCIKA
jgi:hypothetical protein